MAATQIPSLTNQKIIALMSVGKPTTKVAGTVGVSDSYCSALWTTFNFVANEQWNDLIEYAKNHTIGRVLSWSCDYLGTQLPQDVEDTIQTVKWRPASRQKETTPEAADNTAAAIIKLLEKLDAATAAITAAADDICQTIASARKLNEDCINSNFDVLTAQVRDGIESVKTTIRKSKS